ncbi:nuclear transport factor 2 family protein [Halorarum salinum]|uniref:Nuclear transport factor 2 family protein n=1 Tax=Halorarum salinum TaxID=2743089 RepID=A0A7D5Q8M2_9EURY|nr:nuclear transport factor 2 family protein [Halobaculum salinum]QLG60298.1 nuclear transport factor 2 family protein [Halobaculum salinum]
METEQREKLAQAYFDALDESDYESLRSVFSDDVVYHYPKVSVVEGIDNVVEFMTERKPTSNTNHEITRYLHTGEASVCEGYSTGELDGDSFEGHFCDVVEFDSAENRITTLAVYSRI